MRLATVDHVRLRDAPSTARMHASSLGTMPWSTRVSSSRAALTVIVESSEPRSGQSA